MIFSVPRLLLSTAAVAALLSVPSVSFSQSLEPAPFALPDAPEPQNVASLSIEAVANSSSSSSFAGESEQAQTQTPAQPTNQTTAPPMTDEEKKKAAEAELQIELKQRMGGIVPNFNAVLDGSTVPLTPKQKMRAALRSAIDPYQFGLALFTSGIGQAEDSHDTYNSQGMRVGYGQGWAGYGKRFGAGYTDQFDGTIIGNGILPVLLHQDARYFRMGTGSFMKRFLYSMSTTVICRGDNGKRQPNFSNVLGNIAAGGISNLYYPQADRGFGLTIQQGLLVTAEGTFGAFLIEFYPDMKHHFTKNHQQTTP